CARRHYYGSSYHYYIMDYW
nr:immunoglobulin heavy chain junction region [Mus musculus]